MLDYIQRWLLKRYLARHGLPDFNHLSISYNKWDVGVWDKQDLHEVVDKPSTYFDVMKKIFNENKFSRKNTTIQPLDFESKFGMPTIKPRNIQKDIDNIIPTVGLQEMAKRNVADVSTTNTHVAVGDDATAEDLADTALGNELDRKEIDVSGTRGVPTGTATEQIAMPFLDTDFGAVPETVDEAGVFTAGTGGVLMAHVTFATKTVDTGQILTTAVNVTHQNGTA